MVIEPIDDIAEVFSAWPYKRQLKYKSNCRPVPTFLKVADLGRGRSTSDSHGLFDTIRGPTSNYLYSNATSANEEYVGTGVVSFDDDGFTLEGHLGR